MMYSIGRNLLRFLFFILYRLESAGVNNIPQTGGAIICSNHVSLLDPPLLGTPIRHRRIYYMAKEELFRIPLLGRLIRNLGAFPVKRGVGKDAIRTSLKLLDDGKILGIFPEGTRGKGGAGKRGAAMLALRSGVPVIPAAIVGRYAPFRKMKIIYGQPVDLSEFATEHSADTLEKATDKIMSAIRQLVAEHEWK